LLLSVGSTPLYGFDDFHTLKQRSALTYWKMLFIQIMSSGIIFPSELEPIGVIRKSTLVNTL